MSNTQEKIELVNPANGKSWKKPSAFNTIDEAVAWINKSPAASAGEVIIVPVGGKYQPIQLL